MWNNRSVLPKILWNDCPVLPKIFVKETDVPAVGHLVFVKLRVGGLLHVADYTDGHGEVVFFGCLTKL